MLICVHGYGFETGQVGRVFVLPQASPPVRHVLEKMERLWWDKDNMITGISLTPVKRIAARPASGALASMLALKSLLEFDELKVHQDHAMPGHVPHS